MSLEQKIISHSPDETFVAGKNFAENIYPGSVTGFFGELGTGKTHFIKGVCDYFSIKESVSSPTFIIVNEYSGILGKEKTPVKIFHFDLYRLKSISDLINIGFENYINDNSICLIEWAELASEYLDGSLTRIFFEHGNLENERIIKFQ